MTGLERVERHGGGGMEASVGNGAGGGVQPARHVDGEHGRIGTQPACRPFRELAAKTHPEQGIDHEIGRLRLPQLQDGHS